MPTYPACPPRRRRRRAAATASALAAGLVAASWPAWTPAQAVATPTLVTLAGADRDATAAAIARQAFPNGATTAVLVSGLTANLVDGLTATPLAAALHAPILFTDGTQLSATTANALKTLGVQSVVLIGYAGGMPDSALPPGITVKWRLQGATRYATAALVAQTLAQLTGTTTFSQAFVVSGQPGHLIDALAAAPLAAQESAPILLADPNQNTLPDGEANVLGAQTRVIGVGAVAGYPVRSPGQWQIVAGATRYQTALLLDGLDSAVQTGSVPAFGVVDGASGHWVDALSGGPFLALQHALLLPLPPDPPVPADDLDFLRHALTPGGTVYVLGGPAAVSPAIRQQVAGDVVSQLTITASPGPWFAGQPVALTLSASTADGQTVSAPFNPTWSVAGNPPGAEISGGGSQATFTAQNPGNYTVTVQAGNLSASLTLQVASAPLPAARVYFYAANAIDQASAQAAAQADGIPADNVLTSLTQAWNLIAQGNDLVIAVGSPALNNLYYNPCGLPDPIDEAAGHTPFDLFPSGQGVDQPQANLFVDAAGITAQDSATLATDLGYFATHGQWPSGFSQLPTQQAPTPVCEMPGVTPPSSTPPPGGGSATTGGLGGTAPPPLPIPGGQPVNGFDTDKSLLTHPVPANSPYRFALRYLGGPCYPSSSIPLTTAEAVYIGQEGLPLGIIYSGANHTASYACGVQTQAQGNADGQAAVAMAQAVGQPPHTVIFLDVEYGQVGSAWLSYVQGWAAAVAAGGYLPGVYSTGDQLTELAQQPWAGSHLVYWVARWLYASLQVPPPNPGDEWPGAVMWQYTGSTTGPEGLDIDLDSALPAAIAVMWKP